MQKEGKVVSRCIFQKWMLKIKTLPGIGWELRNELSFGGIEN